MSASSKEDLLSDTQLHPVEVDLPSGMTVEVRGLSLQEQGKTRFDDEVQVIRAYLSAGLVEPKLTDDELDLWLGRAPAGDPAAAASKIAELCGTGKEQQKAAYKSVRRGSGSGV